MSPQHAASEPTLLVVGGRWGGRRLAVPPGTTVIGRDPSCGIILDVDGMSRRHARIVRTGDTVTIEDAGSTNGTSVNGADAGRPHELHHGDLVRLGSVELSYLGPRERPLPRVAFRRGRVRIGRAVVVGGLVTLMLLGVGVVVQVATGLTGIAPWIAAPLTGMAAALAQLAKDALRRMPEPPPTRVVGGVPGATVAPRDPAPVPDAGPAASETTAPMGFEVPKRSRGLPVFVAAIVTVLTLGVGGAALAFGVATLTEAVTGDRPLQSTAP